MRKLRKLLKELSLEERKTLCEILDADSSKPKHIIESLRWNSQSVFGHIIGTKPSYREILEQIFKELGIEEPDYEFYSKKELEIKITQQIFQAGLEKMSDKERKDFEKKLQEISGEFDKTSEIASSGSLFAALGAAKLSGFGVYLLASSTLGALSGFGVVLPFAVYTSISSTIAVVIGPVGWISAGLFAVWKLTGPNYKKLIPAIVFIAAARAKLEGGFE
jgi:uncharacterized protein YaaW (UPF0174 family)